MSETLVEVLDHANSENKKNGKKEENLNNSISLPDGDHLIDSVKAPPWFQCYLGDFNTFKCRTILNQKNILHQLNQPPPWFEYYMEEFKCNLSIPPPWFEQYMENFKFEVREDTATEVRYKIEEMKRRKHTLSIEHPEMFQALYGKPELKTSKYHSPKDEFIFNQGSESSCKNRIPPQQVKRPQKKKMYGDNSSRLATTKDVSLTVSKEKVNHTQESDSMPLQYRGLINSINDPKPKSATGLKQYETPNLDISDHKKAFSPISGNKKTKEPESKKPNIVTRWYDQVVTEDIPAPTKNKSKLRKKFSTKKKYQESEESGDDHNSTHLNMLFVTPTRITVNQQSSKVSLYSKLDNTKETEMYASKKQKNTIFKAKGKSVESKIDQNGYLTFQNTLPSTTSKPHQNDKIQQAFPSKSIALPVNPTPGRQPILTQPPKQQGFQSEIATDLQTSKHNPIYYGGHTILKNKDKIEKQHTKIATVTTIDTESSTISTTTEVKLSDKTTATFKPVSPVAGAEIPTVTAEKIIPTTIIPIFTNVSKASQVPIDNISISIHDYIQTSNATMKSKGKTKELAPWNKTMQSEVSTNQPSSPPAKLQKPICNTGSVSSKDCVSKQKVNKPNQLSEYSKRNGATFRPNMSVGPQKTLRPTDLFTIQKPRCLNNCKSQDPIFSSTIKEGIIRENSTTTVQVISIDSNGDIEKSSTITKPDTVKNTNLNEGVFSQIEETINDEVINTINLVTSSECTTAQINNIFGTVKTKLTTVINSDSTPTINIESDHKEIVNAIKTQISNIIKDATKKETVFVSSEEDLPIDENSITIVQEFVADSDGKLNKTSTIIKPNSYQAPKVDQDVNIKEEVIRFVLSPTSIDQATTKPDSGETTKVPKLTTVVNDDAIDEDSIKENMNEEFYSTPIRKLKSQVNKEQNNSSEKTVPSTTAWSDSMFLSAPAPTRITTSPISPIPPPTKLPSSPPPPALATAELIQTINRKPHSKTDLQKRFLPTTKALNVTKITDNKDNKDEQHAQDLSEQEEYATDSEGYESYDEEKHGKQTANNHDSKFNHVIHEEYDGYSS